MMLVPALATPKPNANAPWPYTSPSQSSPTRPRPALGTTYEDGYGGEVLEDFGPPIIPASSLPHEILLHILRLLPPSSLLPSILVCKSWCQCGVELLWHKPSFPSMSSLTLLLSVITSPDTSTFPYHQFIRRLNFTSLSGEMNDGILRMLKGCTRLERLALSGCKGLSGKAMEELVGGCERLVSLDLSDVEGADDGVVCVAAKKCGKLQGVNLSGCKKVTDKGVEAIALGCPGLRRLTTFKIHQIKLRSVESLTDTPIILLSLHCPLLLEVDLISCPLISSLSLLQLFRTSHHLRELSLQACTSITDTGFPPQIPSLLPPPSSTTTLTTTTGTEIEAPLSLIHEPRIRQFDHLRYLDLTSLNLISDEAVRGIVKHAPRIRNLILAKCAGLTDDSVEAICGLGKHLHYLHMGHMAAITDSAVMKLARSCTRLRYIDLACCNLLTDMAVFELAAHLPRLKRIGLVRVVNLTDAAIYALFARSTLERIHLSYCDNLTVQAIHELLQHLPRLTHLSLTGEFNAHQRSSFCVYSGKGVQELRRYLRSVTATDNAEVDPHFAVAPRPTRAHRHHRIALPPNAAAPAAGPAAGLQPPPGIPRRQFNPTGAVAAPLPNTQFPNHHHAHARQIPVQFVQQPLTHNAGTATRDARVSAPPVMGGGLGGTWRWNSSTSSNGSAFTPPVEDGDRDRDVNADAGPSRSRNESRGERMEIDGEGEDARASSSTRPRRATVTRGNYLSRNGAAEEEAEIEEDSESDEDEDEQMG
ncbi:F-box and leucine-rich repeat protein GRR1, partial [Phenoliferia sp. Uapishka_3]